MTVDDPQQTALKMAEKDSDRKLYHEVAGESLYDKCTIFGKVLHFWNWAFYCKMYNKEIELRDLPQCPKNDRSDGLTRQFERYWTKELQSARKRNKEPSLVYPIFKVFGGRLLFNAVFCFIPQIALVFQALIVRIVW